MEIPLYTMLAFHPEHLKYLSVAKSIPFFSSVSAPSPAKADLFPGRRFSPPEKRSQAGFPQFALQFKFYEDF